MAQTIGSVLIDVQADTQKLVEGFDRAEKTVSKTTDAMKKAVLGLTTAYLSLEGVKAFGGMIKGSIDAADSLGKVAEKLNLTISSLSELEYVSGFAGVSIGQLNAAMSAMIRRTGNFKSDGTGAAVKAMEELGISVDFARKNFTDTETTFNLLIDRLRSVEDRTLRTKIAQDLFSKSAADVVRLANMSAEQIKILGDQGKRTGAVFTDEFAKNAAELNDSLDNLSSTFTGFKNNLAGEFTPYLKEGADALNENLPLIIDTAKEITHLAIVLGSTTLAFKAYNTISKTVRATNIALGGSYGAVNRSILLASASQKAFTALLRATPFGIATTAVYLLSDAFFDNNEKAVELEDTYENLAKKVRGLTKDQLVLAKLDYKKKIADEKKDISELADRYEKLQIAYKLAQKNSKTTQNSAALEKAKAELNIAKENLKVQKQTLEEIERIEYTMTNFSADGEETKKKKILSSTEKQLTTSLSSWKSYYEEIGNYNTAWLIEESQIRTEFIDLDEKSLNTLLAKRKELYFDKLKDTSSIPQPTAQSSQAWQEYYETIGDYESAWQEQMLEFTAKWSGLTDEAFENLKEKAKQDYFIKLGIDIESDLDKILEEENFKDYDFKINVDVAGLDGTAKSIMSLSDSFSELSKNTKLWEEYSNSLSDEQKKSKKYANEQQKYFDNQIDGYSAMAGAAAGLFEEQSDGYKALTALQIGLQLANQAVALSEMFKAEAAVVSATTGVAASTANTTATMMEAGANATASVTAAGKGDPYTAPARVAAMIALMTAAMTMFVGGGGSGGVSASSIGQAQVDTRIEEIEAYYEPITNRLDQQIELLESIDRNGSASALQNELAQITFTRDSQLWVEDVFKGSFLGWATSTTPTASKANNDLLESILGFNIADWSGSTSKLDLDSLRQGNNLINTLSAMLSGSWNVLGFGSSATNALGDQTDQRAWLDKMVSEYQGLINDWAISVIDSMNELTDASDSFKESFDAITGSTYYETKRLNEAFEQVNNLVSSSNSGNIENYLSNMINSIDEAEKFLTEDRFNLLLSKNIEDIEAQTALLEEFSAVTGQTFEDGAKAALDYIDAIDLVTEALETSANNIRSFLDSFKTDYQLVSSQASALGLNVATTMSELFAQFDFLKSDTFGLTDVELDYLESAKDYIESLNEQTSETEDNTVVTQNATNAINEQNKALQEQLNIYNTSSSNIESFVRSMLTQEQLTQRLANQVGVEMVDSAENLLDVFKELSSDIDGLTNDELSFLNANKSYIDSLQDTQSSISQLESSLNSITDVIDNLRSATYGSEYTLSQFYKSMDETLALANSTNMDAFSESLQKTIGYSNSLLEDANFSSRYEADYARAVAINQFGSLEDVTLDQIDYLEMIEENTRNTYLAIVDELQLIGDDIINSNTSIADSIQSQIDANNNTINNLNNTTTSTNTTTETTSTDLANDFLSNLISSKYQTHLGKTANNADYNYWSGQILDGNISTSNLGIALGVAAVENGEISRANYVAQLYKYGLGKTADANEIAYWTNESLTPTGQLANMFAQLEPSFNSFDVGTAFVPQDQFALLHAREIVTPPAMSDDIRAGRVSLGNNDALLKENQELRKEVNKLNKIMTQVFKKLDDINERDQIIYELDYIGGQGA